MKNYWRKFRSYLTEKNFSTLDTIILITALWAMDKWVW